MTETIPCPTCGGSGIRGHYEHVDSGTGEHLGNQPIPCPDCIRGRRPSPEAWIEEAVSALEAAAIIGEREGTHLNYGNLDRLVREGKALAAWLAEHAGSSE